MTLIIHVGTAPVDLGPHTGKSIEARRFETYTLNPSGLRSGYPIAILNAQRRLQFGFPYTLDDNTPWTPQDGFPRLPVDETPPSPPPAPPTPEPPMPAPPPVVDRKPRLPRDRHNVYQFAADTHYALGTFPQSYEANIIPDGDIIFVV